MMSSSPKTRFPIKPIATLLLVFFLGAIVGAGSLALGVRHAIQRAAQTAGPHPGVSKAFVRLEKRLSKKLALSSTESAAVKNELMLTVEKLHEIRTTAVDDLDKETRATLQRIGNHIPKEKRSRLNEIAEERLKPWGLLKGAP